MNRHWIALLACWAVTQPLSAQDSIAPKLVTASPVTGATGVPPNTPVHFVFTEAMKPQQAINWIAAPDVIHAELITYAWSADGRELTAAYPGGWPANRRITWLFQRSFPAIPGIFPGIQGLEDLAGNPLAGGAGSFTTSASGPPPPVVSINSCGVALSTPVRATFALAITAQHAQASAADPVASGAQSVVFLASATPGVGSASSVTLEIPGGLRLPMAKSANGAFATTEKYASLETLRAKFPGGTYRFLTTGGVGDMPERIEITLPGHALSTIRVSNFAALQAVDVSEPVTITWEPLGGAANEPLFLRIKPPNAGTAAWASPDPGCPGALHGASTSATIPVGTLSAGLNYSVELSLNQSTTSAHDSAFASAALTSTTTLPLLTCGGGRGRRNGASNLCEEVPTVTGGTPVPAFVADLVVQGRQLRILASPTVPGESYQLHVWAWRDRIGQLTAIREPLGTAVLATRDQVEFLVPIESQQPARIFQVSKIDGRRGR